MFSGASLAPPRWANGERARPVEERARRRWRAPAPQIDAAGGRPVLVLEQALVELAGGVAGELGAEVDRAGALHVGQVLPAVGDELALEVGAGVGHVDGLDDRLHLLAEVVVGHAEDGDVGHLRVQREDVLGLLRVHVHAAGDDHVRLAVGEVEEAVVVEVADVAERATSPRPFGSRELAVFSASLW